MQTTPLNAWHREQGGRMVDFAGWEMPIQYTTISEEHHAVRKAVGLFDISHMGRLVFTGPDAARFLDHIVTNDVTSIGEGRIRYALVCNEAGGVLDDVLVYNLRDRWMLVVNASNREKIIAWIETHTPGFEFEFEDQTFATAMLAVQGPRALQVLEALIPTNLATMKYYTGEDVTLDGHAAVVSRTGYTGEDGCEVIVPAEFGVEFCQRIADAGTQQQLQPCGLGCRDTLRLEAAMPLYGHELSEDIDPLSVGLAFAVKLDAGDFIGKDALAEIKQNSPASQRIGLQIEGRRIAREGCAIFVGDDQIGEVTSGTFSPTLERTVAMGLVRRGALEIGNACEVDIRGRRANAEVVKLPFYSRT